MRKRYYIAAAALAASIAALAPVSVNAGPAVASVRLAQSAEPVVVHVQAQPSAGAPTAATPPSEQPRRRFRGPILGSIERAANPDGATTQSNCAGAKVRSWDAASRRYVYTDDPACK